MNKDKQIEEMAKAIYNLDHCEGYKDDRGCMYAPTCSVCKYGRENKAKQISELLARQGYRKADDVARQIFEEIETAFDEMIEEATDQLLSARLECDVKAVKTMEYGIDVIRLVHRTLKKSLKKKYIGEDTNVLTNTEDGECLSK